MIPFVKEFAFEHGQREQLSPLVSRVIAKNPGPFTFTGTGTYFVGGEKGVAVIDPGPSLDSHLDAILETAPGPITHILVTHTHSDHSALAAALQSRTDAPIYGFSSHPSAPSDAPPALDEGADFGFSPDIALEDGSEIAGDGWHLRAVHTPGHISNHLCFNLAAEKTLFTGDHIMGWATTVVAPPDGEMGAYMRSLDLLLARDDSRYLPTHGAPIEDPLPFVAAVKQHRQMRDQQILAALTTSPQTAVEIVAKVYEGLDRSLIPAASLNVRAHLEQYVGGDVVAAPKGYARAQ